MKAYTAICLENANINPYKNLKYADNKRRCGIAPSLFEHKKRARSVHFDVLVSETCIGYEIGNNTFREE